MTEHADIFIDIQAHIASGRFIRDISTNRRDIREFTFCDVDLRDCREVLDLGCSYGFFTRGLAGRLHPDAMVTGMDLWPQCEQYFLRACRDAGFPGKFLVSDSDLLHRFADASFDLVLCSYALYFFPDALGDIARVLRSDGLFITVTHSVPHMQELVDIVKELLAGQSNAPVPSLPLETLFNAFSDANGLGMLSPWFGDIREKKYENELQVSEAALPDLINYLCFKKPKFLPPLSGLDEQFFRHDVARYIRQLLARKGSLKIAKGDTVYICRHPQSH